MNNNPYMSFNSGMDFRWSSFVMYLRLSGYVPAMATSINTFFPVAGLPFELFHQGWHMQCNRLVIFICQRIQTKFGTPQMFLTLLKSTLGSYLSYFFLHWLHRAHFGKRLVQFWSILWNCFCTTYNRFLEGIQCGNRLLYHNIYFFGKFVVDLYSCIIICC